MEWSVLKMNKRKTIYVTAREFELPILIDGRSIDGEYMVIREGKEWWIAEASEDWVRMENGTFFMEISLKDFFEGFRMKE